jgi:hypothetical protein
MGARRSWASACLPWSRRRRARLSDAAVAEAGRPGHLANAPVRAGRWLLVQGLVHDPLDRRGAERRLAPRSSAVAPQAGDALGEVALLPAADRHLAHPDRPRDRHYAGPVSRLQHDPRPPHQLLRRVPSRYPPFQRRPIRRRQPDACFCLLHAGRLARLNGLGNHLLGSKH